MQLAEIKDPRIGQIRKDERGFLKIIVAVGSGYCLADVYQYNTGIYKRTFDVEIKYSNNDIQNLEIYGQIGITHRKDGNGLYEIPREEFERDVVVEFAHEDNYPEEGVIDRTQFEEVTLYDVRETFKKDECDKIGILGVNYEYVNDSMFIKKKKGEK